MPNYRRWFVPGGSYFFTLVVQGRRPLFKTRQSVALLGNTMRECRSRWPLRVNAIVLLPDHLRVIWTLPPADAEYPKRWGWIKKEFTKQWLDAHGGEQKISPGHRRERRRGVWQPRYWEHTLEDEDDFERHFDYIHWNPVKHGYVRYPDEWPYSSFHRYVKQGVYMRKWGCFATTPPASFLFNDICRTTGE